jgi:hypothetical protein
MISPKELYFRNKLVIADKKGKGIGGFITRKLSPHMVSIFTSILKDEEPKDLHKMTPDEIMFYNAYLRKALLHKKFPTHDNQIADLKRRLNVLEGQISAGNDNKKIKDELCQIATYLQAYNAISKADLNEYIRDLRNA